MSTKNTEMSHEKDEVKIPSRLKVFSEIKKYHEHKITTCS